MTIIHSYLYDLNVYILPGLPLLTIILNLCEIICQIMHEIDILNFVFKDIIFISLYILLVVKGMQLTIVAISEREYFKFNFKLCEWRVVNLIWYLLIDNYIRCRCIFANFSWKYPDYNWCYKLEKKIINDLKCSLNKLNCFLFSLELDFIWKNIGNRSINILNITKNPIPLIINE